ncbi:hypothetical protein NKR23_g7461 [Pleurostoma richardsiae]|uniref:BZIP domain-containing protein n=1 Tax=Pleurostoma richardsiae TaxID=41990 RepID=A0AA38R8E8_9PEZI|nr:hypothetical protein NKR23_g7461 [Pleurostoma richardsiae]
MDRPPAPASANDKTTNSTKATRKSSGKRNSDARKEQNRIASRTYRERRKQKLALLGQLLGENQGEGRTPGQASTSTSTSSQRGNGPDSAALPLAADVPLNVPSALNLDPSQGLQGVTPQVFDFQQVTTPSFEDLLFHDAWAGPLAPENEAANMLGGRAWLINDSVSSLIGSGISSDFDMTPWSFPLGSSSEPPPLSGPAWGSLSQGLQEPLRTGSDTEPSSTSAVHLPVEEKGETATEDEPTSLLSLPSAIIRAAACFETLPPSQKQWVIAYLSDRASVPAPGDTRRRATPSRRNEGKLDDQRPGTLGRLLDRLEGMHLPNVRQNTIYVMQTGFFTAILENAISIGLIKNQELLDEEAISPFNVITTTASGSLVNGQQQIAEARLRFSATPQDLQPVDDQLIIEHHPYLDIIPFPSFRSRALQALACEPPLFDEEEMCHDMRRDALIVWGSQGQKDSSPSKVDMGAAMPWDKRSWEPQVWFLKKYWFLVGGVDDEMWRAARWWHDMRNEKLDVSAGPS